jgi:hypothetical protein
VEYIVAAIKREDDGYNDVSLASLRISFPFLRSAVVGYLVEVTEGQEGPRKCELKVPSSHLIMYLTLLLYIPCEVSGTTNMHWFNIPS